ncbi:hypothetical protein [Modicisalibacter sp. MOD 31.J]|uniref:hypothetical protein n=1 Tax=Modicisalibacter sp. MOD 31.J TaxID=2831897 RepID=UPI001CCBFBA1|nr:hypothetical protein [Modicisalibacter sp. MOD 31.J]MBZ9574491.1 hypothetical protein [Modicisalibacter sp. MOD 31.J]
MTPRYTHLDSSFSSQAIEALRRAGIVALCRRLLVTCPPAAGIANRVAECIGQELTRPEDSLPLLFTIWSAGAAHLRTAEQRYGTNDPHYLVAAVDVLLSPIDAALGLEVSAADGHVWRPDEVPSWAAWRERHPGDLTITPVAPSDRYKRRVELERWALGSLFTEKIRATKGWPNNEMAG